MRVILSTQVDDRGKEPFKQVRIPTVEKRGERAELTNKRRARLSKVLPTWQVNDQMAKEQKVMNQVEPNPRFSRVMPEKWQKKSPHDDVRMFSTYQSLMHESRPHFEKVKL